MAFPPPPGKARSSKDERRPAPHSFFRHPGEGGDLAGASGGEGEIVFQSHVPLNTLRRDDKIGFTFVPAPAKPAPTRRAYPRSSALRAVAPRQWPPHRAPRPPRSRAPPARRRPEERRVGNEVGSTCRSRGSPA